MVIFFTLNFIGMYCRATRKNLTQLLISFVKDGEEISCTDESLAGAAASVRVRYQKHV